ncbi:hypothetical protein IWX90DRAFT_504814 [Phyllosticta citrichinensis]|uniref:Nucleotide exchange factor GrpE n=1 Tax=Phyllosticta citrichinensis TaxID=1130410 RepID=A0ABR1XQY5_9PEZI
MERLDIELRERRGQKQEQRSEQSDIEEQEKTSEQYCQHLVRQADEKSNESKEEPPHPPENAAKDEIFPTMTLKDQEQKFAQFNRHLSEQTQQIDSLREELKAIKISKNDDEKNAALEAKIQDFKMTELPVMRSLAKLLYSVEQMYDEVLVGNAGQEKDSFLADIKEDLGSGRYAYFRRIGKMISEEGLDFPELEMYQVTMEED